jgi:plastocyanin
VFAFSRILLALDPDVAPWVALLFAVNILVGCALAAALPGRRSFAFLGTVLVATIIGGGIAGAVVGEAPVHSLVGEEHQAPEPTGQPPASPTDEPTGEPTGPPPAAPASIVAEGVAFDTDELRFPPESEVGLHFVNEDSGIPHNVAIYQSQGGEPIFQGEIITGPAEIDYRFTTPAPGEYYFQCDVHPNMSGSVAVG